jgi:hypothetical protein
MAELLHLPGKGHLLALIVAKSDTQHQRHETEMCCGVQLRNTQVEKCNIILKNPVIAFTVSSFSISRCPSLPYFHHILFPSVLLYFSFSSLSFRLFIYSLLTTFTNHVKGKFHPRKGHEDPESELRYSRTLSLTSDIDGVW